MLKFDKFNLVIELQKMNMPSIFVTFFVSNDDFKTGERFAATEHSIHIRDIPRIK